MSDKELDKFTESARRQFKEHKGRVKKEKNGGQKKLDKEKHEKRIRELEERIRKLEEKKETAKVVMERGGTDISEIIKSAGGIFGLRSLIKSVEKLPDFQGRLKEIDKGLTIKFGGRGTSLGYPLRSIPPVTNYA